MPFGTRRSHARALLLSSLVLASGAALAQADARAGSYYFSSATVSSDGALSCASCHSPQLHFQDGYERALARRVVLTRNTPSLLNTGRHGSYFWDGRATSLEHQVEGPLFSRAELNSSADRLHAATSACAEVNAAWQRSGLELQTFVVRSLAAFVRALGTAESRFERFLAGQASLSPNEQLGWEAFNRLGCSGCHVPPRLTDDNFHDIGLPRRRIVLETTGPREQPDRFRLGFDYGRLNVSGLAADAHRFRTPSLYHVTRTGPYMHNGSFTGLDEVLDFYSRRRVARGDPAISATDKVNMLHLLKAMSDSDAPAPPSPPCDPVAGTRLHLSPPD